MTNAQMLMGFAVAGFSFAAALYALLKRSERPRTGYVDTTKRKR